LASHLFPRLYLQSGLMGNIALVLLCWLLSMSVLNPESKQLYGGTLTTPIRYEDGKEKGLVKPSLSLFLERIC